MTEYFSFLSGEPYKCFPLFPPRPRSLESSPDSDTEVLVMPGSRHRNMYVTSEGALKIEAPEVNNSGR